MTQRSPLLSLLHREWRNARTMTLVFVVLVPLGMWASAGLTGEVIGVCDAATAVFVVALASDLVAGEKVERLAALTLLPARPELTWAAKALFLLIAAAAFATWSHLVAAAVTHLPACRQPAGAVLDHAVGAGQMLFAASVAAAFLCLLFSTLVSRGIAALFLTLAGGGAIWGAGHLLSEECGVLGVEAVAEAALPWLGLALVFAAGSALAFAWGGLHRGAVLRPCVLGLLPPLAVLVLPAAWVGYVARTAGEFALPDRGVTIAGGELSPDGRWLILQADYEGVTFGIRYGWFVVEVATGESRRVPVAGIRHGFWTPANRLLLETDELAESTRVRRSIDPLVPDLAPGPPDPEDHPRLVPRRWIQASEIPDRDGGPTTWRIEIPGSPRDGPVPPSVTSPFRGAFLRGTDLLYWKDLRHYVRLDTRTMAERVLIAFDSAVDVEDTSTNLYWRSVHIRTAGTCYTLDPETGAELLPPMRGATWTVPGNREGWFVVQTQLPSGAWQYDFVELTTLEELRVPSGFRSPWLVQPLGAGRMLVTRPDGTGIDICDAEGRAIRTVVETGGAE